MSSWEDEKRAAQTAFLSHGDSFEAAHASVDSFYRQILTTGYAYPSREADGVPRQAMTDAEIEKAVSHDMEVWESQRETGLEPER